MPRFFPLPNVGEFIYVYLWSWGLSKIEAQKIYGEDALKYVVKGEIRAADQDNKRALVVFPARFEAHWKKGSYFTKEFVVKSFRVRRMIEFTADIFFEKEFNLAVQRSKNWFSKIADMMASGAEFEDLENCADLDDLSEACNSTRSVAILRCAPDALKQTFPSPAKQNVCSELNLLLKFRSTFSNPHQEFMEILAQLNASVYSSLGGNRHSAEGFVELLKGRNLVQKVFVPYCRAMTGLTEVVPVGDAILAFEADCSAKLEELMSQKFMPKQVVNPRVRICYIKDPATFLQMKGHYGFGEDAPLIANLRPYTNHPKKCDVLTSAQLEMGNDFPTNAAIKSKDALIAMLEDHRLNHPTYLAFSNYSEVLIGPDHKFLVEVFPARRQRGLNRIRLSYHVRKVDVCFEVGQGFFFNTVFG